MSANTRLVLGTALLVLGLVMPAGAFFVAATDWPAGLKAAVSGVLLLGLEVVLLPAVALLGKENYERIVRGAQGLLRSLKPAGNVGRRRYEVGLWLFAGPVAFAWVAGYVPSWLPEGPAARVWLNVGLDLLLLASLFLLGGDFWDKLGALFRHDARAVFPPPAEAVPRRPPAATTVRIGPADIAAARLSSRVVVLDKPLGVAGTGAV